MARRRTTKTSEQNAAPIQVAANRSGLNTSTIRAWEQRYAAVVPRRSATGRRLYSEADIQRLALLKRTIDCGYRIGNIADLSPKKLEALIERNLSAPLSARRENLERPSTDSVMEHFDHCMAALAELNAGDLQEALNRATRELSPLFFLDDLLTPLIHHVRGECYRGALGNGHLRVFQSTVSSCLLVLSAPAAGAKKAPGVITCSLQRDNDLYALRAAAALNTHGFPSIHLGDQIAAAEVFEVLDAGGAHLVVLCSNGANESVRGPNSVRTLCEKVNNEQLLLLNPADSSYAQVAAELNVPEAHGLFELIRHAKQVAAPA